MANLPVGQFLEERLDEFGIQNGGKKFEVRQGTGFEHLFFKPLQFIIQPIIDEATSLETSQSFRRILLQEDPDAYDEEAVDALASNFFVDRQPGSVAGGTARVYYDSAVDREWPANGATFTGSNGKTYTNPAPFSISVAQMGAQIEGGNFYYDIPIVATEFGEDSDLEIGNLVSLVNDPDVITVTNKDKLKGGRARETNTQLIERIRRSIAVRDLVTGKGFNAILFENFASFLTELQPIGFGDEEMMRDILFNTHVGGRIDGYFKSAEISIGSKNFVGLLTDLTRQAYSTTNVVLTGADWFYLGNTNLDRSGDKAPIILQVKPETPARRSSVSSFPVDLSVKHLISIGIDGVFREIDLAGSTAAATTRNEIVTRINSAFGYQVAFPVGGAFELRSRETGTTAQITIKDPAAGSSASCALEVFGLSTGTQHVFTGDGPIKFIETVHYLMDDENGKIRRVIGANQVGSLVSPVTTGSTTINDATFEDLTPSIFAGVEGADTPGVASDILTITSGPQAGDYRILEVVDSNTLILDKKLTATASGVSYYIHRTGIKNNEAVYAQFWFNPLSIDIGPLVKLDELGRTRGIRAGREDQTITDVAFLRVRQIEIIDPISLEPTGEVLSGKGGYGLGGYGEGPYGIGSASDYYMVVNEPHERFSAFEDSMIILDPGLIGLSFRVEYEYVPELMQLHNFVRSENERLLGGDLLMKHFLPAYVSGTIEYRVDATDSSIPDNDALTELVKEYINQLRSGVDLQYSDLYQFISRKTDPFDRYGTFIRPFELTAEVHNTDGSTTIVTGTDKLTVPTPDPFPKETTRPLSPRITHWVADNITLVRLA